MEIYYDFAGAFLRFYIDDQEDSVLSFSMEHSYDPSNYNRWFFNGFKRYLKKQVSSFRPIEENSANNVPEEYKASVLACLFIAEDIGRVDRRQL